MRTSLRRTLTPSSRRHPETTQRRQGRRRQGRAAAARGALCLVLLALLGLRAAFIPYRVTGPSMAPTLVGTERSPDWVIVSRLPYWWGRPRRGDIVVLRDAPRGDHPVRDEIKRVVGLPGERLELRAGRVWVNGAPLDVPGASGSTVVCKGAYGRHPTTLAEDEIFVLGDNSYLSRDSRSFGPVRRSQLVGKALAVVWPWSRLRALSAAPEPR